MLVLFIDEDANTIGETGSKELSGWSSLMYFVVLIGTLQNAAALYIKQSGFS